MSFDPASALSLYLDAMRAVSDLWDHAAKLVPFIAAAVGAMLTPE